MSLPIRICAVVVVCIAGIAIGKPDLRVTDIWNEGEVIWYQVINEGDTATTGTFQTALQVGSAWEDVDSITEKIGPGQRRNRSFEKYLWHCSAPSDPITVVTDSSQSIDEDDETDNSRQEVWKCDTTAPKITVGPTVSNLTTTSAEITWTTDEDSDSIVRYGTSAKVFSLIVRDISLTKSHLIKLNTLSPATTYHFRAESTDGSGNTVQSVDMYLRTLPTASGPVKIGATGPVGKTLPLQWRASEPEGGEVDRVEFYLDDTLMAIDYSAPYECWLNPYFAGMSVQDLIGAHSVTERAYAPDGTLGQCMAAWSWADDCLGSGTQLEFRYPAYGHVIHTDTMESPQGELDIYVYAVRTETIIGWMNNRNPELPSGSAFGGFLGQVPLEESDLEFSLDGVRIWPEYLGLDPWMEDVSCFRIQTGGLDLGNHRLRVRTTTDTGCTLTDGTTIAVERNRPNLEIERRVIREDTWIWVDLSITNRGSATVMLDLLTDTVTGFQCQNADYRGFDVVSRYTPQTRKTTIEMTFSGADRELIAGETDRFFYLAIPVLYKGIEPYRIGGEGSIQFHDAYEAYEEEFDDVAWRDTDGHTIRSCANWAISESNYLIVTNPIALYRMFDAGEVDDLMASVVDLAFERRAVIGHFNSYYTIHPNFQGGHWMGTGDLFNDHREELILLDRRDSDTVEDLIQVYSATSGKLSLADNELPIRLGFHALYPQDTIVVGNVMAFCHGGANPPVEIVLVDGHSSGEDRGDITVYQYNRGTERFEETTFHVNYDPSHDTIAAGDIVNDSIDWFGDEILVAHDNGTVDIWGELNAARHRTATISFEPGDRFVVGNVIGDSRDDFVVGDISENRIIVYESGASFGVDLLLPVDLAFFYDIAVGDVIGNEYDEILVANGSDETVTIYDFGGDPDAEPTILTLEADFTLDDWLYVADVIDGGKGEVLIARGNSDWWNSGNVDILHIPEAWESCESRWVLDELISEHGDWTDRMAPDWINNGYLLIVGETTIVPTFKAHFATGGAGKKAPYTDMFYASTSGADELPELAVGRIIGETPNDLRTVIETSIELARGDSVLDNSDAYLVSGYSRGTGGTSDYFDFAGLNDEIENRIDDHGFSILRETTEGTSGIDETDFFAHAVDQDIIHLSGHGNPGGWDILSAREVRDNFRPGTTHPLITAMSCSTGSYPFGRGLAESFLQKGAGAYIGASSTAQIQTQYVDEYFYDYFELGEPLGMALRDAKRTMISSVGAGATRERYEYNCAINQFYGDPALTFSGGAPAPSEKSIPVPPADPPNTLKLTIPNFTVQTIEDKDQPRIPGQAVLTETGKPIVPIYTHRIDLPAGWQVQDVVLEEKGGLLKTMGLELPLYTERDVDEAGNVIPPAAEAEGYWPLTDFDWTVSTRAGGGSTLQIHIHPFFYNAATTQVRFYRSYQFRIQYGQSQIEINKLSTDKGQYAVGEPVKVQLWLYNPTGQAIDAIVELSILDSGSSLVKGLPLRTLRNFRGLASMSAEWDTTGAKSGPCIVHASLKNTGGVVLDTAERNIEIGIGHGKTTALKVTPECFGTKDSVLITSRFENTGDVPLDGEAVIEIQTLGGKPIETYRKEFTKLAAGDTFDLTALWDSGGFRRGTCRIFAYANFDGQTSNVREWPGPSAGGHGDLNQDRQVDIEDFAILAAEWLDKISIADISPEGGDCRVDLLDLKAFVEYWMTSTP